MATFLVELYLARGDVGGVERSARAARLAAEQLTREGTPVRFVRSLFVPDDETCFYVYEAASVETVREAARRAALPFERVTEAVADPTGE